MASKFQSRLVGTIILVAIGVIVLPDVLDGKKMHYQEEITSIPIKPELNSDVEKFEILEPVEDQAALPESPVSVTEQTTPSSNSSAKVDKPMETVVKEVPEKMTTKTARGSFS